MEYIQTDDGSNTLYSKKYNQNFHSKIDGALNEANLKYVIPTFNIFEDVKELNILDICFGLGYNTFATILYILENNISTKINFYSPEFDRELIKSLEKFDYPKEFERIANIIKEVSSNHYYQDEQFTINLYIGDARKYIKTISNIDVVYQDAFSSDVNKELWTIEYFKDIKHILSPKAILLTYSIATPVRLGLFENNLKIFQYKYNGKRKATIATNYILDDGYFKYIDMDKKKINNPLAKPLYDEKI